MRRALRRAHPPCRGHAWVFLALALSAAALPWVPSSVRASTPEAGSGHRTGFLQVQTPGQDTIPAEPQPEPADPGADTLQVEPDPEAEPDLQAEPDTTVRVRNLPAFASGTRAGWTTGVWEWDRERLHSTRAQTLLELLASVPGVVPLRGGDYGQPTSATAFGVGGGRIRVFWDGVEMPPLDGAVVDLDRVVVAALESVRVERGPGELRIELTPLEFTDPRPYSFLEVGTGDLETNLFRGVFAHPDAMGGSIVLALDRLDTAGPLRAEPGVTFGGQIRHNLFIGDRLGVAWEFRRMTSRRPPEIWSPTGVQRTDWGARGRYEISPGLVAGLAFQRASVSVDVGDDDEDGDTETESLLPEEPRTQVVGRLSLERERWWAEAEHRQHWGDGWSSSEQALRAGGALSGVGGGSVALERQVWEEESPLSVHARLWSRPLFGVSAFAEIEDGGRGVPGLILSQPDDGDPDTEPEPVPEPDPASFTERSGFRAGLEYRSGELFLGGAVLSVEADSLHPTGLPTDRDAGPVEGGSRTGFEGSANLPLDFVLDGLALEGSAQYWDDSGIWRYLPTWTYDGRVSFHEVFLESENLEVWADVGVWGRDPMSVPIAESGTGELATVPFYQSWFGRLQIRVVSVRAFVRWDNFTLRESNQDYPGRVLPQTRVMWGIRWTMWN